MSNIICYGESLIDFTYENNTFTPHQGGSPYNVAVALGRLGIDVGYVTQLSNDMFGDMLEEHLKNNHVRTNYIKRTNAPSTLAFVKTTANQEPEYAFYSNNAADVILTNNDLPKNINTKIHHFGSISIAQEPCGTAFENYITDLNGFVSFDPNIRPSLIPDRKKYLERFNNILQKTNLLRMSLCDFQWLFPKESKESFVDRMFKQNIHLVAITAGENGSWIYTPDHTIFQEASNIKVMDTIGAGDTYTAGLLSVLVNYVKNNKVELITKEILNEAICTATVAAAINCSRKGANPPTLSEIKTFAI